MIDTSGEWTRGDGPDDIAEWLRAEGEDSYPVGHVTVSRCAGCGGQTFRLEVNAVSDDGVRRTCTGCGATAFIADSEEYWEEDGTEDVECVCDGDVFEVAVGFALLASGDDVKWITVATRCVEDGIIGSPADWKISYGPSMHLLQQA